MLFWWGNKGLGHEVGKCSGKRQHKDWKCETSISALRLETGQTFSDRLSISLLTLVLCGHQRYFAHLLSPQNVSCDFRMLTESMLHFSSRKQMIYAVKLYSEVLILKYSMKGSTCLSFKLQNNTRCPASFISGLCLSECTGNLLQTEQQHCSVPNGARELRVQICRKVIISYYRSVDISCTDSDLFCYNSCKQRR